MVIEDKRLEKPEIRKLAMPGKKGPFSGRSIEGEYWGQDIHKVGSKGPEDVAIYGSKVAKEWFKTDFKLAAKYQHDRVISVTGREGYGKSTLAIGLGLVANPDLSINDIIFRRENLDERLRTASEGETIIVDEAGISLFAQEWWDKMQRQVIKRLVSGRIKGMRIFFVSPHLGMLNKQIRERRLDMWLYAKPVGRYGRGEAQLKEPHEDKYKLAIYWEPRLTMKFEKIKGELWDKYLKKKKEFTNDIWENVGGENVLLKERLRTVHLMSEEGKTSKEIAEYLTISPSTVRNYRQKLEEDSKLAERVLKD